MCGQGRKHSSRVHVSSRGPLPLALEPGLNKLAWSGLNLSTLLHWQACAVILKVVHASCTHLNKAFAIACTHGQAHSCAFSRKLAHTARHDTATGFPSPCACTPAAQPGAHRACVCWHMEMRWLCDACLNSATSIQGQVFARVSGF